MKKLIAIFIIIFMVLTAAGCGDVLSEYESALVKTESLRQLDMDIKLNIAQEDISSSDAVLDIPVEMNIKAIFNEDDSLKRMSAVIKETTDEGEIEREYIYKQNNVYKETLSTRRRSKIY